MQAHVNSLQERNEVSDVRASSAPARILMTRSPPQLAAQIAQLTARLADAEKRAVDAQVRAAYFEGELRGMMRQLPSPAAPPTPPVLTYAPAVSFNTGAALMYIQHGPICCLRPAATRERRGHCPPWCRRANGFSECGVGATTTVAAAAAVAAVAAERASFGRAAVPKSRT